MPHTVTFCVFHEALYYMRLQTQAERRSNDILGFGKPHPTGFWLSVDRVFD